MLRSQSIQQQITLPTRVSMTKSSLLDIFGTNNPTLYVNSGVVTMGLSDHDLIVISRKGLKRPKAKKTVFARSFMGYNLEGFRENLRSELDNLPMEGLNLIDFSTGFFDIFLTVSDRSAPYKEMHIREENVPWLNDEYISLIHEVKSLARIARQSNDPLDVRSAN